jgi:hypothetical protein
MVLISGPVIAKLALRTRKWAHEHMRRGTFGPLTVDSYGVLYADLIAVSAAWVGRSRRHRSIALPVAIPPASSPSPTSRRPPDGQEGRNHIG